MFEKLSWRKIQLKNHLLIFMYPTKPSLYQIYSWYLHLGFHNKFIQHIQTLPLPTKLVCRFF